MIDSRNSLINSQSGTVQNVGLISDTHIPVRAKKLPWKVFEVFEKVNLVIHAGDLVDISVVDRLERFAPVLAVYGNMDGPKVRGKLPRMASVEIFDWRIGVTHNPRASLGIQTMRKIAEENRFDILVYGHTHNPKAEWTEDTLFINPGSTTTDLPPFVKNPSVALLRITRDKITPEIVYI